MGVFYHLRYPLFALDKIIQKVGGKLVFQTMMRGSEQARAWDSDYPFWNKEIFRDHDFPAMYFIEKSYSNDPTNWWIPWLKPRVVKTKVAAIKVTKHRFKNQLVSIVKPLLGHRYTQ
jgi:tRNA (mo5U34)-methyltransferase